MNETRKQAEKSEKMRARKRDNKMKLTIVLCFAFAVVVAGTFFAVKSFVNRQDNNTTVSDKGFPCALEGKENTTFMRVSSESVVVLDNSLIEFLSPGNGKTQKSVPHFFSNPVFDVHGKYVLTFDQGRTKYRIDTAGKVITETETQKNIIDGAIAENGTYALALSQDRAKAQLVVYSKSLKELFTWNSTQGYIIDIAVSTNGKYVAAACANSLNASVMSTVHIFEVKSGKEISKFDFDDQVVAEMFYSDTNDLFVITDNSLAYISNNAELKQLLKPSEQVIESFSYEDGGTLAVQYSKYENSANSFVDTFDEKGNVIHSISSQTLIKGISRSKNYTLVLTDKGISAKDDKGKDYTAKAGENATKIVSMSNNCYIINVDKIETSRLEAVKN